MERGSPFLGSVCSPPERAPRRIYVSRCPQCGNGPMVRRSSTELPVCSIECERRFLARKKIRCQNDNQRKQKTPKQYRQKLSKKQRQRKRREEAERVRQQQINREVNERVVAEVTKLKRSKSPKIAAIAASLREKFGASFYTTKEWVSVRYEVMSRSKGACMCCGRDREDGVKLHVDHIKPRSRYPELALAASNLQVLCEDCNMGKGAWDETDWR